MIYVQTLYVMSLYIQTLYIRNEIIRSDVKRNEIIRSVDESYRLITKAGGTRCTRGSLANTVNPVRLFCFIFIFLFLSMLLQKVCKC
jgi:hypothetical protein